MNKYTIEFGTRYEKRIIGDAKTIKECHRIIIKFLDDHDYESYYQRVWIEENKAIMDVGSWTDFFWISHSDGSAVMLEEITKELSNKL